MTKKEGPFRRFAQAMKEIRKQPLNRDAVERFNRIIEKNDKQSSSEKETQKPIRKIARPPEADV
jgi:hypothetical protein